MNFSQKIVEKKQRQKIQVKIKKQTEKRLRKARLSKIQQQSTKKTGNVMKTKLITKKTYQTYVQKQKQKEKQLPLNVHLDNFYINSSNYQRILSRTQHFIQFDKQRLIKACQALIGYSILNKQKIIDIIIYTEKQIVCDPRPIQIKLPTKNKIVKGIIISNMKNKMKQQLLKDSKEINLQVINYNQFINKYRNKDKKLLKELRNRQKHIFIDFQIFKVKMPNLSKILQKGVNLFPINTSKIPYSLSQKIQSYKEYLIDLMQSYYFVIKKGNQHFMRLNVIEDPYDLCVNIQRFVHQIVAKMIEKSTNKGNRVIKVQIKTLSSSNIEIYKNCEIDQK